MGASVFKPTTCLGVRAQGWIFAYSSIHLTVEVFGFTRAVERVASRIYVWLFLLLLCVHPCLHLVLS
jgi:hypothetical protein